MSQPLRKTEPTALHAQDRVFTERFLTLEARAIAESIRKDGYFSLEGALAEEWTARLAGEVEANRFAINRNWASGVYFENQYYLTSMLACSKAFAELVTHEKIFDISEHYLGAAFRLKAMRYYETYGRHHMQWHTDNKTDRAFAHIPGLIFIAYVEDVEDGEFQLVRGSQHWSGEKAYSDYSDDFIARDHGQDIISFKAPKGTVVIYDTYGIHRAKPVMRRDFVRKSLFFQVDSKIDSAEPILLNPAFFPPEMLKDERMLRYLGFGQPAEYSVFPDTSLKHLQMRRLNVGTLARWAGYRLARTCYDLAPNAAKNAIRRMAHKSPR